ncbi:MAG: hypothetical protein H6737_24140 [Alphaproteobacteria bacterium]|nr:hypothetical protein [Alphaproteobacteria bacterium]
MTASFWSVSDPKWRHLCGLKAMATTNREVVWVTVPRFLLDVEDGDVGMIQGYAGLNARNGEDWRTHGKAYSNQLINLVNASGLPKVSPKFVVLGRVHVPTGEVEPSPAGAWRRLAMLIVLKLPFQARDEPAWTGTAPYVLKEPTEVPAVASSRKLAGIHTLPGGYRNYAITLRELLEWIQESQRTPDDFRDLMDQRYDAQGETNVRGYWRMLVNLGLMEVSADQLSLTDVGSDLVANWSMVRVFELLNEHYQGMLSCWWPSTAGFGSLRICAGPSTFSTRDRLADGCPSAVQAGLDALGGGDGSHSRRGHFDAFRS